MYWIVKNISIHWKYVQYYMRIYNCTVKCYKQMNQIIKEIFLSSLISLRNGIVFRTNIQILSKPQLNHNSTQSNITLSWVRHENDFAYHPTPPPTHRNLMLAISQLLLTWLWWNFKGSFLGTSRTNSNKIWYSLSKLQPNKEFDTSAAQLVLFLFSLWDNQLF